MRGRTGIVLAGLLLSGSAFAQTPHVTLIAAGNTEVASVRFAKLTAQELGRRKEQLVSDAAGSAALERPLSAAVNDCSGDEICYTALGQVVNATQVLVLTAAFSTKDARNYECFFRVIDVKAGKTRGPMVVTVIASEAGLSIAANTVAENVAPRPKFAAAPTPTPLIPAETPSPVATAPLVAPTPAPAGMVAVAAASPTATPGVDGLDQPPPRPRGPKKPLTKDPAFWSVAGAGALALTLGLFFGARSLDEKPKEEEGTSTVEVRF